MRAAKPKARPRRREGATKTAPSEAAAARPSVRVRAVTPRVEIIRESRPRRKANVAEVLDDRHTGVTYSAGSSDPYGSTVNRILRNPDPIIAEVGGWKDCGFYEDMLLRHPWLAGIVDQRVEKANKPRLIVPGDPSDDRSVAMADDARRKWKRVQSSATSLAAGLRNGRFIGPGGLEKVFTRDADGLVYPVRLINRPPRNIRFRDDGTALWLSNRAPFGGEEIPFRKMMFIRGGSLNTPYPEVELAAVYPATYLIERAVELLFDGVEEFGRPIPKVYMPRAKEALTWEEREAIRAYARAIHRRFIELPTDASKADIDVGDAPLAASGQVGRPETAIIEMMITWCYIRILRITQTLNKTGGSRALEEVRYDITDDASRPDCALIDDSLNALAVPGDEYTGWMTDFNDFNFPNAPEEMLPRFETPTLSLDERNAIHDRTMDAVDRGLGDEFSKDWYLRSVGAEKAKNEVDRLGGVRASRERPSDELPQGAEPQSLAEVVEMANALSRRLDAMLRVA